MSADQVSAARVSTTSALAPTSSADDGIGSRSVAAHRNAGRQTRVVGSAARRRRRISFELRFPETMSQAGQWVGGNPDQDVSC